MKKILCMLLCVCVLFSLSSCGEKEEGDSSGLTMYVGLGLTGSDYYATLKEKIYEATGVSVKYIFNNTSDTSNTAVNMIENQDLPADIMITASYVEEDLQKDAFLDLSKYTNVPDLFTVSAQQSVLVEGGIYQLPYCSRLIGVEYNKTLLEELGWELPRSYDDMVELKKKADEEGILFAVSGGVAAGHGFNYLFHLMGTQYLNTPDGDQWLKQFQAGESDIEAFAAETDYFENYVSAGLFGEYHSTGWDASNKYCRERALFYYNIINDVYSYDGYQYTEDGSIVGASYTDEGEINAIEDENGEAVFYKGEYILYDAENEEHQGLTRYTIPGATVLHDEYGSMPWLSENGFSNCFTSYNCMYVALDKKLVEEKNSEKLSDAVKVLEFMAGEEATALFTDLYKDGYVPVEDFEMDDTRLYAAYAGEVSRGYLMQWYYNDFDIDSIMAVGEAVNSYIAGGSENTLPDILDLLTETNQKALNGTPTVLATVEETLDYKDAATLSCIANGLSLQAVLEAKGIDEEVTASLLPYTEALENLPLYTYTPVVQVKFYQGDLKESILNAYVTKDTGTPCALRMTGQELLELSEAGFTLTADDDSEYHFLYCVVLKDDAEIDPAKEYLVAVPAGCLTAGDTTDALLQTAVTLGGETPVGSMQEGLKLFAASHPTITKDGLDWK